MTQSTTGTNTPEAIAHLLIVETETYRGGTFSPTSGLPFDVSTYTHAFAVAEGRGTTRTFASPETQSDRESLHAGIVSSINEARDDSRLLGTWIDGDGTWYVDIVDIFSDPIRAIVEGRTRGELAVYDLKGQREYDTSSDAETLSSIREYYGDTTIPELPAKR